MNTNNFQFPSVLIPHVWDNITKEYIISVFEKLNIADVARVDMIPRDNSTSFMAFVHMNYWYDNTASQNLRNKILRGDEGRIVYDDPWHWVIVKAKNPRLNLVTEVTNYSPGLYPTKDIETDPRIDIINQNVTQLANQTDAQAKMICYLQEDLFHADKYIFELEQKLEELADIAIPQKKVKFEIPPSETAGASSPSKLPTPSIETHFFEGLTIDTDFKISDDEIDDGDIDCGDFSEMASRQVADELQKIRNQRNNTVNIVSNL